MLKLLIPILLCVWQLERGVLEEMRVDLIAGVNEQTQFLKLDIHLKVGESASVSL